MTYSGLHNRQISWILFLKYLDDLEHEKAVAAELAGRPYAFIIDAAHKWSKWAAPRRRTARSTMTTR